VSGGLTHTAIVAGTDHTCSIATGGAMHCWGVNIQGELGDGTTTDRLVPTAVSGGLSFTAATIGFRYTCGITTSAAPYCWGSNSTGMLGDGTLTDRLVPTAVIP
jgi:hypothetical protein